MVYVLPRTDFKQEMCRKPPTQYTSPDGGSDPIALEPTSRPICTQCICNPVWSVLTHDTGVAG